ncbi:hypothetical protein FAES_0751 [Fibrella aestuarina BUZ 2]|uniref:Uncharacterized protein n=1 Tax=Fibrella aestuarina BUZ 2 TaxID=1166018 RepID=I0K3Q9_9BACT|nr:hypothetical protein [Fibrella aestuarina]CCG98762.1 hypothetical protein FAES_0751 [Fibrella aestuarina BUZ 2]
MAASSALSDGAQQANMVSNENAETMFGTDQAETNMVKLVDGKLTPIGDTDDDVMDEQLRNRYSSDEERSLQGYDEKTYENSDAALRVGDGIDGEAETMPADSPIAEADLTDNQPANTAAANESTPTDRTQANGADQTNTFAGISADMVPTTPSTPDPNNPVPAAPETPQPPTPPSPGPEIPDLPGSPQPDRPEITEPSEPGRSHEINARSNAVGFSQFPTTGYYGTNSASTPTSTMSVADNGVEPTPDQVEPGEAVPGTQYVGMSAGPDDEGMDETPNTGDSSHPYRVNGDAANEYRPDERPNEAAQMQNQPREAMDESGVKAQDMLDTDGDRSDTKSTDGLDRKYNDPQAARDMAS